MAQRDPILVWVFVGPLSCNEWAVSGSRRRGSGRRQQKHVESWVLEALGALNWFNWAAAWFDGGEAFLGSGAWCS